MNLFTEDGNYKRMMSALLVVLLTVFAYSMYRLVGNYREWKKTSKDQKKSQSLDNSDTEDSGSELNNDGNANFDYSKLLDTSTDNDVIFGSTDKYEWSQNETEIDMYIFIPEGHSNGIRAKDVHVEINTQTLRVNIHGNTVLDGTLYAKVLADDCLWQLDTNRKGQTTIWITLYKAIPTVRNQHWKCVIRGDGEINVSHLGPPVHGLNASNQDDLKSAAQKVCEWSCCHLLFF